MWKLDLALQVPDYAVTFIRGRSLKYVPVSLCKSCPNDCIIAVSCP